MNIASSAESLADDAAAYAENPTEQNFADLLASMRIMARRIVVALKEIGEDA